MRRAGRQLPRASAPVPVFALGWLLLGTWPSSIDDWTPGGTPTEGEGAGGATRTGDDDAAGYESHAATLSSITTQIGDTYRVKIRVRKDADDTRFPEFQITGSVWFMFIDLNTKTGATQTRNSSGVSDLSVSVAESDGVWTLDIRFTVSSGGGSPTLKTLPAVGNVLGAAHAGATGTVDWYPAATIEKEV